MRYTIILLFLVFLFTAAEGQESFKPEPKEDKKYEAKIEGILKSVKVGMTREKLYELFNKYYRTSYLKDGNEEWITFRDWVRNEPGEISFYLKNGRVKSWETKKAR